jgi:hypothetical protein
VLQYHDNLASFVAEVSDEAFKEYSLDSLFELEEGARLLCEAVYLYAVMLLLTDRLLPGSIRERIIVAIYRYRNGEAGVASLSKVRRLFKDTGYTPTGEKRPKGYPE